MDNLSTVCVHTLVDKIRSFRNIVLAEVIYSSTDCILSTMKSSDHDIRCVYYINSIYRKLSK